MRILYIEDDPAHIELTRRSLETNGGKFEADLYFEGGKIDISQDTIQEWISIKNR